MDKSNTESIEKVIPLFEAAKILQVTIDTLLKWNEYNILKPTITANGEVGYKESQIIQFLEIKKLSQFRQDVKSENTCTDMIVKPGIVKKTNKVISKPFALVPFLAITGIVASITVVILTGPGNYRFLLSNPESKTTIVANKTDEPGNYPQTEYSFAGENGFYLATLSGNLIGYSQNTNRIYDQDTTDPVFDENGNIKGKTDPKLLAVFGSTDGLTGVKDRVRNPIEINLLIVLLALALMTAPFIFRKKQFVYNPMGTEGIHGVTASDSHISPAEPKILEVTQKTDGTVVMYFQGQEYRVCKPELDSESDQFIERLMGLTKSDNKEVDYDILQDSEIRLDTPLSRLVTRLGFVGIKRDLFFPRTSKNKVLFRKFLTQQDLDSMNINTEQVSREITSSN